MKTNGDKIRKMSNEELIKILNEMPYCSYDGSGNNCNYKKPCINCIVEYVNKEVEE